MRCGRQLRAFDRLGPAERARRRHHRPLRRRHARHDRWARVAKPGDFRNLATVFFGRAAEGDQGFAFDIAAGAARAISTLARGALALGAATVALVGVYGAKPCAPTVRAQEIATLLSAPLHDATDGAILSSAASSPRCRRRRDEVLAGARIFDGERLLDDCAVTIEGDSIRGVDPVRRPPSRLRQEDLDGGILAPGFIDWQINGGGGVLFNAEPTVEGIAAIAAAHRRNSVTGFLPTVIADTPRVLTQALAAGNEARKHVPGALGSMSRDGIIHRSARACIGPSSSARCWITTPRR